ncbi:MAG: hypothetical protein J6386_08280 [Candidatus Synoicihabitans palmerolidicus]|nr:hypothetical protein [Candidatus Synoicihabitans palmerolidicus]
MAPDPGWENYTDISYAHYLRLVTASVGAFPLPSPEDPAYAAEPVHIYHLPPGAYTVTVKFASGQSGEVLLEIYETRGLQGPFVEIPIPSPSNPTPTDDPAGFVERSR